MENDLEFPLLAATPHQSQGLWRRYDNLQPPSRPAVKQSIHKKNSPRNRPAPYASSDSAVASKAHSSTREAATRSSRRRSLSGSSFDGVAVHNSPTRDVKKSANSQTSRLVSPITVTVDAVPAPRSSMIVDQSSAPQARPRLNSHEQPPPMINTQNKNNTATPNTRTKARTKARTKSRTYADTTAVATAVATATTTNIDSTINANFNTLDNALKTYRLSRLSRNANPKVQTQLLDQIVVTNKRFNKHVQQLLLKQLMNIFTTIKHIEMAEHATNKSKDSSTGSNTFCDETDHLGLVEMYQAQREVALASGISSETIMVAALAVMKQLCRTDSISNVPANLSKHNPFAERRFQTALAQWQEDEPTQAGRVIDATSYLSGDLFCLSKKKSSGWLPSYSKNSRKWKNIRLLVTQKQLQIYDGKNTEKEILSTASEPLFAISMHNGLVVTPIKVYVNRNNEEKFSFALVEKVKKDGTNNGGNKDGGCRTTEEIVRFSSHYPMQFQFLTVVCQSIVDSFH
jgi:hypothetical protein